MEVLSTLASAFYNRLPRGAEYAQSGRVRKLVVVPGRASAEVVGSRNQSYRVALNLRTFTEAEWDRALSHLGSEAIYQARLLAGELPETMEHAFKDAGLSLFPSRAHELTSSCSCPDMAETCKHVAALHYLLAGVLDSDPFVLFELRGRSRDEMLNALSKQRVEDEDATDQYDLERGIVDLEEPCDDHVEEPQGREPLEEGLERPSAWEEDEYLGRGRSRLSDLSYDIGNPDVPMAALRRLGPPPTAGSHEGVAILWQLLYPVYKQVSERVELIKEEGLAEQAERGGNEGEKAEARRLTIHAPRVGSSG